MALGVHRLVLLSSVLGFVAAYPSKPLWFRDQLVDHFSTNNATWSQRHYMESKYFKGAGYPIFVIMGGESGISPETGIFYPWVVEVLAKEYGALVVEPEHRFYGESLPFGSDSFTREHLSLMNTQQALADAALLIRAVQSGVHCGARGTKDYCPVLTIGGSYPGFLSAMMRLRYPAVVDMAYAASAPMRFYSQEVGQYEYYARVTESAERSLPGCASAVKVAFEAFDSFVSNASIKEISDRFMVCDPLPSGIARDELADDLRFLAQQTFANLNMGNYPPDDRSAMHSTCRDFAAAASGGSSARVNVVRNLLITSGSSLTSRGPGRAVMRSLQGQQAAPSCFNLVQNLPAGDYATARCGDWSGCGSGHDGEMWDYQTCSFEVEHIGFGSKKQMFAEHPWTMEWLSSHCHKRFGTTPQPLALKTLWGFDAANLKAVTSRIVFTNGLNDGWSVGGILEDISLEKGLLAINLPNGAHHSDLTHTWPEEDTPDVVAAHTRIVGLVGQWLKSVRDEQHTVVV